MLLLRAEGESSPPGQNLYKQLLSRKSVDRMLCQQPKSALSKVSFPLRARRLFTLALTPLHPEESEPFREPRTFTLHWEPHGLHDLIFLKVGFLLYNGNNNSTPEKCQLPDKIQKWRRPY